jgi:IclR family pca regulon transcriptional regulator
MELKKIAYPYLENLWKEMGETVNLAIPNGVEIIYVERIKGQHTLNVDIKIGSRLPVFCTSMGRAMLAALPEERWDDFLSPKNMISLTPRTLTKREAILKELRKAKFRGFAVNNEEVDLGIRSVAAPIRNLNGDVVAAVNIAVPSIRVSVRKLETVLAKKVVDTAERISASLGYTSSFPGDGAHYFHQRGGTT